VVDVVMDLSDAVVPLLRVPGKSSVVLPATASVLPFCILGLVGRLRPETDPALALDLRILFVTIALSDDESGEGNAPGYRVEMLGEWWRTVGMVSWACEGNEVPSRLVLWELIRGV
jgi:hypothetical protein